MPEFKKVFVVLAAAVALLWIGLMTEGCGPHKPNQPPHTCVCTFTDGSMKAYSVMDVEGLNEIVFSINKNENVLHVMSCNCPSIGHE